MSGDTVIRRATAIAVIAVAAIAAIISYSHIYDLAHAHGQNGTAARLLPLSVDGLILTASLVMLYQARRHLKASGLARSMLWLGVIATLGANAEFGAGFGLIGVLVSLWPAIAFIGSVEMIIGLIHNTKAVPEDTAQDETQDDGAPTQVPRGASKANAVRMGIDALRQPNGPLPDASAVVEWLQRNASPEHHANSSYVRDIMRRDGIATASGSTQMHNGELVKINN